MSRSTGVDVITGEGLDQAFAEVDVAVDTCNVATLSAKKSVTFFSTAAANILAAARRADLAHVLRLSIIGVDRNPHGFYAGQLAGEQRYSSSDFPTTVLRAAQFHEFARQTLHRASVGPVVLAPRAPVQPVAVDEVAQRLLDLAQQPAAGRARDLAGPQQEDLAQMVRTYAWAVGRRGLTLPVRLPTAMIRGMAAGHQLPDEDAELGSQTFQQWIDQLRP